MLKQFLDLIKKVIPKLSRNKKEDISNGLQITSKKVNNKRTIIQSEAPREYDYFKGSRYSRVIKTEIENDQITNIVSDDNLYMQSQPEEKEIIYGPKDFHFDSKSEINSDEIKYNEKDNIDLVNKLAEKFIKLRLPGFLLVYAFIRFSRFCSSSRSGRIRVPRARLPTAWTMSQGRPAAIQARVFFRSQPR